MVLMFSPTFWRRFYFFAIPLAIVLTVRNALMDFYFQLAPSLRFCFEYNAVVWGLWLLITPCLIRQPGHFYIQEKDIWSVLGNSPQGDRGIVDDFHAARNRIRLEESLHSIAAERLVIHDQYLEIHT
jgi:hypothetical protein